MNEPPEGATGQMPGGVNPPAAAKRGRGRGSPAVGHSLATARHDGRSPSVTPGFQIKKVEQAADCHDVACLVTA